MCRVTCVGSYFGGLRHSKFFNLARQEPSHTRKREGEGGKPLRGRSAAPAGVNDFMFPT